MTKQADRPDRLKTPPDRRPPAERAIIRRAAEIADASIFELSLIYPGMPAILPDADKLSDVGCLSLAFTILGLEHCILQQPHNRPQVCGWCVVAAGGDQAAELAAHIYSTRAELVAHVKVCPHNPHVKEIAMLRAECELAAKLRAATLLEINRLKAEAVAARNNGDKCDV